MTVYKIFDLNGSSWGSHGIRETPASNCFHEAIWEATFDSKYTMELETLLTGCTVVISDYASFRSYHECQVAMNIFVEVPMYSANYKKISNILGHAKNSRRNYAHPKHCLSFVFVNFNHLVQMAKDHFDIGHPANNVEDVGSEAWWGEQLWKFRTWDGD